MKWNGDTEEKEKKEAYYLIQFTPYLFRKEFETCLGGIAFILGMSMMTFQFSCPGPFLCPPPLASARLPPGIGFWALSNN